MFKIQIIFVMKKYIKKAFFYLVFLFVTFSPFKISSAENKSIMIFAPASLKDSLSEVLSLYKKEKNIDIKEVYLGTAQLAQQIKNGADPDFFISANIEWMNHLENRELVLKDYTTVFLSNSLVAITNQDNFKKKSINYFTSIKKTFLNTNTRISLAMVDAVPAGIYAKEFFQNIGIWEKIKLNVANSPNVRAALSFVSRGDLEYGVVYKSDAVADDRVKVIYHLNPDLHTKIEYPLSVLNDEENTMHLYFFLRSRKTSQIFKDWGFVVNYD